MTSTKYESIPVQVEAQRAMVECVIEDTGKRKAWMKDDPMAGKVRVPAGHWIVKHADGCVEVLSPDEFAAKYREPHIAAEMMREIFPARSRVAPPVAKLADTTPTPRPVREPAHPEGVTFTCALNGDVGYVYPWPDEVVFEFPSEDLPPCRDGTRAMETLHVPRGVFEAAAREFRTIRSSAVDDVRALPDGGQLIVNMGAVLVSWNPREPGVTGRTVKLPRWLFHRAAEMANTTEFRVKAAGNGPGGAVVGGGAAAPTQQTDGPKTQQLDGGPER